MKYDTTRFPPKISPCAITRVYPSGMVDARSSEDGKFFEHINIIYGGAEISYAAGDRCIVLTDGNHHYVIGKIRLPDLDSSGKTTIRNLKNDLSDLENVQALVSNDEIGTQVRVVASVSAGVIIDGGDMCIEHFDPYKSKIYRASEREERITVPQTVIIDHEDGDCNIECKMRSIVDNDAVNRDFEYSDSPEDDLGLTCRFKFSKSGISLTTRVDGDTKTILSIAPDGEVVLSSTESVKIQSGDKALLQIEPQGSITMDNGLSGLMFSGSGKLNIEASGEELLTIINDLIAACQTAVTGMGVPAFANQTAQLLDLKTRLSLMRDL